MSRRSFTETLWWTERSFPGVRWSVLASAVVGMVAMFGVLRLFSPHFSSSPSSKELSYTSVLDESAAQSPRVEIELEKPSKKVPREHLLL
jgi:hypothetical protein